MDQEWRDHFSQTNVPMRNSEEDEEKRQYMFDSLVANTSLQETLLEQVRMTEPPLDATGGRGLWLIHRICDRVDLRSGAGGTRIQLEMSLR